MERMRGLTLVEVLIVMAIIGILAGLLTAVVASAMDRARVADGISMLRQVGQARGVYEADADTHFNWSVQTLVSNGILDRKLLSFRGDPVAGGLGNCVRNRPGRGMLVSDYVDSVYALDDFTNVLDRLGSDGQPVLAGAPSAKNLGWAALGVLDRGGLAWSFCDSLSFEHVSKGPVLRLVLDGSVAVRRLTPTRTAPMTTGSDPFQMFLDGSLEDALEELGLSKAK